jgi:hypothetical protein
VVLDGTLKAEWVWGVLSELEAARLVTLADMGIHVLQTREANAG